LIAYHFIEMRVLLLRKAHTHQPDFFLTSDPSCTAGPKACSQWYGDLPETSAFPCLVPHPWLNIPNSELALDFIIHNEIGAGVTKTFI
jgi:hypothetical protein